MDCPYPAAAGFVGHEPKPAGCGQLGQDIRAAAISTQGRLSPAGSDGLDHLDKGLVERRLPTRRPR